MAGQAAGAADVVAAITGYGPLQPYFDDPTVEEIVINSASEVHTWSYVTSRASAHLETIQSSAP